MVFEPHTVELGVREIVVTENSDPPVVCNSNREALSSVGVFPFHRMMRRALSVTAVLAFVFIAVCASANPWTDVFLYHPVLMAFTFMGILPELMYSVSALHGFVRQCGSRRDLVQMHRHCAITLKVLSALGIIMVEWSKFSRSKSHFTTWHARIGAACEASQVLEVVLGLVMYYGPAHPRFSASCIATLRRVHRCVALVVLITALTTMFLGMFSHFALRVFGGIVPRLAFAVLPGALTLWAYFGAD